MQFPTLKLTTSQSAISEIIVGNNLDVAAICSGDWSSVHVVFDVAVSELARKIAASCRTENLIKIDNAEAQKSFAGLEAVCKQLADQKADRHSLVINVGGGALCDLGGFAAAIYMRGIGFVHVPTTLLAQVDASVGGKTAINALEIKNSIGSFTQPRFVIVDVANLRGLSERDFASGCAELLKHGLIADKSLWEELSAIGIKELRADEERLAKILHRSCEIKYAVVAADEHETGERKKLNFGHTVGHAIESLSHTTQEPYTHGEAVAIGMIAEAQLSDLSAEDRTEIKDVIAAFNLPTSSRTGFDHAAIVAKLSQDKKNKGGQVHWTLLKSIGEAVYDQQKDQKAVDMALGEIGL